MDAPQAQCTRDEQHAVVLFMWSEGSPWAEIHKRLLAQCEDIGQAKKRSMSGLRSLKVAGQV